jgi:hypothetical protein
MKKIINYSIFVAYLYKSIKSTIEHNNQLQLLIFSKINNQTMSQDKSSNPHKYSANGGCSSTGRLEIKRYAVIFVQKNDIDGKKSKQS